MRAKTLMILAGVVCSLSSQAACEADAYRQFDFWLGDWQVHLPDGRLAGHNAISQEYGQCVIHERYRTPSGYAGESLNTYDPQRDRWHQTWVDNAGTLLLLEGSLSNGVMELRGETRDDEGRVVAQRIRWTPQNDGSVRQLWESAGADGNWSVVFDGHYTRVPAAAP